MGLGPRVPLSQPGSLPSFIYWAWAVLDFPVFLPDAPSTAVSARHQIN